jgi:hypothetical protein
MNVPKPEIVTGLPWRSDSRTLATKAAKARSAEAREPPAVFARIDTSSALVTLTSR